MPPTLILIRHGEALHNVSDDWSLRDPPLSELGIKQCAELEESLKKSELGSQIELIVVSPMRRTLQTATHALKWWYDEKDIKVLPDARWQENNAKPCDIGSPISILAAEFPHFDFSSVDPLFPDKTSDPQTNPFAFTRKAVLARAQSCLRALHSRPEKVIAVVSHSGFLRSGVSNKRYFNADWRVFDYDDDALRASKEKGEGVDGEGIFVIREWKETEEKGGGMGRSEQGSFPPIPRDFPAEVEEETTTEVPA